MASVLKKNEARAHKVCRVGRCLRGWIDGESVFRYFEESPARIKQNRRLSEVWFEEGWFSRNLLDE